MYLKQIRNIYTKNNYITWFSFDLLNIINYIAKHLKYIILIMKNKY